jgi:plasmid stabilization system protein ParE
LFDIDRATRRHCERPFMGRPRDEVLANLRSIRVHPYTVFYRAGDRSVAIVRVLHERRDFSVLFPKPET